MVSVITFFTHLRPMEGEFAEIQRTAIASWAAHEGAQIVLMGPDCEELAEELAVDWSPISSYNELGTALVNDIFKMGQANAEHEFCCAISSDIVWSLAAAEYIKHLGQSEDPFAVGLRFDVSKGNGKGKWHAPGALDYFIFKTGTLGEIPPFAVGRTAYDQWLLWAAREEWKMQTIDFTGACVAVHINHGYPEYGDRAKMKQSAERKENIRLAQATGCQRWYTVDDTEYKMSFTNGIILK